jgi:hypothetical protein
VNARYGIAAGLTLGAMSCLVVQQVSGQSARSVVELGRVDEGGVTVVVGFRANDAQSGDVIATFSPNRPTFHLYSKDLPLDGVDGLGRPTLVEVASGFTARGPLSTDSPTIELRPEGLGIDLPVYGDGPVTFTLPVQRTGGVPQVTVLVSYAACSAVHGCLQPVRRRSIEVTLPAFES